MKSIITLTGPSCSGKSTLESRLNAAGFGKAISTTTRQPRPGEVHGEHYYFVTPEEFEAQEQAGAFVESIEFNSNRYGVTAAEMERLGALPGPVCIIVEPLGAIEIIRWTQKAGWKCLAVFVDAAPEVLAERFMARALRAIQAKGGDPDQIAAEAKRLSLMLEVEREWVAMARDQNRTIYDIVIYRFDATTEARVVQLLSTEPQMVYHPASNDSEAFDALDKLQGAALHGG